MLNAILWMSDFIWKSEAMHGTNQGPVIWTFGRSTRVNISDSHFFQEACVSLRIRGSAMHYSNWDWLYESLVDHLE
jgi:hypothetical protein